MNKAMLKLPQNIRTIIIIIITFILYKEISFSKPCYKIKL